MNSGVERWESHLAAEWRIKEGGMRAGMNQWNWLANPLMGQWGGRSTQDIESSLDALRGNLDTVLSQAAVCELHPFIGFGFIAQIH